MDRNKESRISSKTKSTARENFPDGFFVLGRNDYDIPVFILTVLAYSDGDMPAFFLKSREK